MTIDRYLSLYEDYRKNFLQMQKIIKKETYKPPRYIPAAFLNYTALEKEYKRRERILTHASARLEAAIARIPDTAEQTYLICKYFYGLKNCEIADRFAYCERHMYRIAKEAKVSLKKELLLLMPKPRKSEKGKVFRKKEYCVYKTGA